MNWNEGNRNYWDLDSRPNTVEMSQLENFGLHGAASCTDSPYNPSARRILPSLNFTTPLSQRRRSPVTPTAAAHKKSRNLDPRFQDLESCNPGAEDSAVLVILKRLVQDVSSVKVSMTNVSNKLDKMLDMTPQNIATTSDQQLYIPDPFKQLDLFLEFDTTFVDNQILKNRLMEGGGDSLIEAVGRMLKKILDDDLAVKMSMWGHKGNFNFSTTRIWKTLKACAMTKKAFNPEEKKIEKAVSEWFRHASQRLNSRNTKKSRSGDINIIV